MARPSKYKTEYCEKIVAFFSGPKHEQVVKSVTTGKNEYEKTEYVRVPKELPTFAKFAQSIGVNGDTVVTWAKTHEEFSAAYNTAKEFRRSSW